MGVLLVYGDVLAHPASQSGERPAGFNGAALKAPPASCRHGRIGAQAVATRRAWRLAALPHARYKPPQSSHHFS
jgi:hypothetical protein